MKSLKKIMVLSIFVVLMLVLTGCGDKVAITPDSFKSTMEAKGFDIVDATTQFEEGDVEKVYIALNENYQIEFYLVATEEQAIVAYNTNKTNFENTKSNNNIETSVSLGNNSKYTLSTGGKYNVVSRIENTFIYVSTDDIYKEEISSILKELGY